MANTSKDGVPFQICHYQPFFVADMIYCRPNFKLCINWRWTMALLLCCCLSPMSASLILFHLQIQMEIVYILFNLFSMCPNFYTHDTFSLFPLKIFKQENSLPMQINYLYPKTANICDAHLRTTSIPSISLLLIIKFGNAFRLQTSRIRFHQFDENIWKSFFVAFKYPKST